MPIKEVSLNSITNVKNAQIKQKDFKNAPVEILRDATFITQDDVDSANLSGPALLAKGFRNACLSYDSEIDLRFNLRDFDLRGLDLSNLDLSKVRFSCY